MESAEGLKVDNRMQALKDWLQSSAGLKDSKLKPMPGDASFRRYFRVPPYVAMDAPPPRENCAPFVAIARALRAIGLQTPEIIEADIERGFLLLSDFGDQTYIKTLSIYNVDELYQRALYSLSILQSCQQVPNYTLPLFNAEFMWQEWQWHQEWFLQQYLGLDISENKNSLDQCYGFLVESAVEQPQVFMHRDYHSANLMVLPNNDVGILDFQDAFIGPVTYDLASLLRDCYVDWPGKKVEEWVLSYLAMLQARGQLRSVSEGKFLRWFDLMGLQRHLKALMTFARKQVRDQQEQYLMYIPRTLNYVIEVSSHYKELAPLHDFYLKVKASCAR